MTGKQVSLNQHHVRALRAVLEVSDHLVGEVEDQLPGEEEDVTLELDGAHIEVLGHLLEAYQFVQWEELPDGKEYRADLDVVRDVENAVTEN